MSTPSTSGTPHGTFSARRVAKKSGTGYLTYRLVKFFLVGVVGMSSPPSMGRGDEPLGNMVAQALQGKWILVTTEEGGKDKRYPNRSLVFADREYRFYVKALLVRKAVLTLDTSAKPYAMDLLHQIGPTSGQVAKCLFKLEGDSLTIAQGFYGKERPTKFDSKDETCSSVTVWRRPKE